MNPDCLDDQVFKFVLERLRLANNPSDGIDEPVPEWGVWRRNIHRDEGGESG